MKKFILVRGGSTINFKCDNNDIYDSKGILLDDNGQAIYTSEYWNTDYTVNYKGGILSAGKYYAIISMAKFDYKPDPVKIGRIFRDWRGMDLSKIKSREDIPDAYWRLPSDVPNPNQNNNKYMDAILLHEGGYRWDYSHGCLTALNYSKDETKPIHEFDKFISNFSLGEIIEFELQ